MRSNRSAAMAAFALAWLGLAHPDLRAAETNAALGDSADGAGGAEAGAAVAEGDAQEAASAGSEAEGSESEDADEAEPAPPLWMETYAEGVFSRHDDRNLSGFSDFKIGKRFPAKTPVDLYLKTRLYRDQRDFFWNNRVDAGAGARVSLLKKVSLTVFGEILGGQYLRLSSGAVDFQGMQSRIDENRAAIDQAQKQFQAMYKDIFQAALLGDDALNRQVIARLDTTGNTHLATLARLDEHLTSLETARDSLQQVMDSVGLIPAGGLRSVGSVSCSGGSATSQVRRWRRRQPSSSIGTPHGRASRTRTPARKSIPFSWRWPSIGRSAEPGRAATSSRWALTWPGTG